MKLPGNAHRQLPAATTIVAVVTIDVTGTCHEVKYSSKNGSNIENNTSHHHRCLRIVPAPAAAPAPAVAPAASAPVTPTPSPPATPPGLGFRVWGLGINSSCSRSSTASISNSNENNYDNSGFWNPIPSTLILEPPAGILNLPMRGTGVSPKPSTPEP